tara:strand:- start:693 stop:827 length:135 start_codon:yes stop_codon:yes gene_type:complete
MVKMFFSAVFDDFRQKRSYRQAQDNGVEWGILPAGTGVTDWENG